MRITGENGARFVDFIKSLGKDRPKRAKRSETGKLVYPAKYQPDMLRFAKNQYGASIAHSGPNRAERRSMEAQLRTGWEDNDGKYHGGWRTKKRRQMRHNERALSANGIGRPIRVVHGRKENNATFG